MIMYAAHAAILTLLAQDGYEVIRCEEHEALPPL